MLDVVIIGAGLSGLQAALSLQEVGYTFAVLEARSRVGGKTWSVPTASGRGFADLGATWLNEFTQPRIGALVKRFGLKMTQQRLGETALMQVENDTRMEFPYGTTPGWAPEERHNLEEIRDHIQARSLQPKETPKPVEDLISVAGYVRGLGALPKTVEMVNLWTKAMHGLESTQVSIAWCLDFLRRNGGLMSVRSDDKSGGCYQRLNDGGQSVSQHMARLVGENNIYLATPVNSIEDHRSYVTITTANGKKFNARKCIVSLPSTMYHELNISPPLPLAIQEMAGSAIQGDYGKAIICYDRPWWIEKGFNGLVMSYSGPVALVKDTSVEENRCYALLCFINGEKCRAEWSKLYPHERRAQVLHQLAHVFDCEEALQPIEFFDQVWKDEPYSKGCLCPVLAFGHLTKYADVYGKPVGNMHFVGTEYASHWKGHMEGALDSGQRGAREVKEALGLLEKSGSKYEVQSNGTVV